MATEMAQAKKHQQTKDSQETSEHLSQLREIERDIGELELVIEIGQRRLFIEGLDEKYLPVASNSNICEPGLVFGLGIDFLQASQYVLDQLWNGSKSSSEPTFYAGDPDIAALYSVSSPALPPTPNPVLSPKDLDELDEFFVAENFDLKKFSAYFQGHNTNSISTVSVVWLIQRLSALLAGNVARALSD
jgi:hypothetical protein